MVLLMKAPESRLRKSTCGNGGRSACVDSMILLQVADFDLWTYFPRGTDVQVFGHFSARWAHPFFECHGSLHEGIRLLKDLAGRHGSNKKLRFAAFDSHHFPEFGMCEDWVGIGWIDGVGLGLVENDHGRGCCWIQIGRSRPI